MTQAERRAYLIGELLKERHERFFLPEEEGEQKRLLRALFNVRGPLAASPEFLEVQDAYLREEIASRGVTSARDIEPVEGRLCIRQGDITTLECGAVVNAANRRMLGCFCPNHGCIDNAIHTFAGVQLRLFCASMMGGRLEQTGGARITPAFNLPCDFVVHAVGPEVRGPLTPGHERLLAAAYEACFRCAEKYRVRSMAFCCISTGEFRFPPGRAAEIAVETVRSCIDRYPWMEKVIFNVFKDSDAAIYQRLLG
ncbi:protein-ADP-ribose hydrolase [Mailhella massiliensis]|uniref:Protein-ADP-ribose hydrolase n=1 Tax=Mailhella massiliensis TaxID=1903261 RepID=A0A921AYV8_9BACT|nr:protein-ADP-ribose hydrolase [Mailhella massiliensis]HJD98338.1 protein-ADP-ribose hydrolase [Mailhella massiliensis]